MFSKSILMASAKCFSKFFSYVGNISTIKNFASSGAVKFGCACEPVKSDMSRKSSAYPVEVCKRDLTKVSRPDKVIKPLDKTASERPCPKYSYDPTARAETEYAKRWFKARQKKIQPTRKNCSYLSLEDTSIAITGGFGSIGRATCESLLQRNVGSLGILDIREDKESLERLKQKYPNKAIYYQPIDVTKRHIVEDAFNAIEDRAKGLDVFINCSSVLGDGCPEKTLQVNLLGTVYTTLMAMERMGKHNGRKGGLIVNVASVLGLVPCNAFAIYSSSKHGQVGFTRSLADDFYYKRTGVKLMLACPGMTETCMTQDPEGSTTFPYAAILGQQIVAAETQSAEVCGENVVRALERNKNGSIWIMDLGKYYEVKPLQYWIPIYKEN